MKGTNEIGSTQLNPNNSSLKSRMKSIFTGLQAVDKPKAVRKCNAYKDRIISDPVILKTDYRGRLVKKSHVN